jgi:hypothetical protein
LDWFASQLGEKREKKVAIGSFNVRDVTV